MRDDTELYGREPGRGGVPRSEPRPAGRRRSMFAPGHASPSGSRAPKGRLSVGAVVFVAFLAGCGEGDDVGRTSPDASLPVDTTSGESVADVAADSTVGAWFLDVDWRAIGNEPFWGVSIGRDGLVFSELAGESVEFPAAEPRREEGGFTLSSALNGRLLAVELRAESCSDGMSDRQYEWVARVEIDGRRLEGCAIRDPLPTEIPDGSPIAEAGLRGHVESARRVRNEGGRYERVEGTLGRQRGADADFVAWFEGDDVVAIDLRVTRGIEPLFETSYYFGPPGPDGDPGVRLVDSDSWNDAGEHRSALMGFDEEGGLIGGLHQVDGNPVDPEPGFAEAELAGARDLMAAARAAREARGERSDRQS